MNSITILHVFLDEKFFDSFSYKYDLLKNVNNLYCLYTNNKNYCFKFIKQTNKVKLIYNWEEYLKLFSSKDIDIILFHSIRRKWIPLFNYIDNNKTVIWWSWGGDIYNTIYDDVEPLIKCNLYKPITEKYIAKNSINKTYFRSIIYNKIKSTYHYYKLRKAIKRIDYMIPSMSLDFQLLKEQCGFFKADIFPDGLPQVELLYTVHNKPGNILIGNSLTYTNNHLDIFNILKDIKLENNRKFIVPINYGWGDAYGGKPDNLISLSKLNSENTIWLKDYLNHKDYFDLFENITHAIFGVIRQQALGNIYQCLSKGIKVYLYKDSIVAKQLKEDGYIFFSIEDDLDTKSLSEPLLAEVSNHNFQIAQKKHNGEEFQTIQRKFDLLAKEKNKSIHRLYY